MSRNKADRDAATEKELDTVVAPKGKPVFQGIHAEFLADETPEICLEGARESGKSWVCAAKVILSCLRWPGIHWLVCRYSNEETKTKIRPLLREMCARYGVAVEWDGEENCFIFPEVNGLRSRIYAYGLKSNDTASEVAKVRGLEVAGVWVDQVEEMKQRVSEEIRFGLRQPGYPHRLIFSPNPTDENHFITDQFPVNNSIPNRKYYRVSLYDNEHNIEPKTITKLLQLYPPTHALHRSLILGLRGVNIVGQPVYDGVFKREKHVTAIPWKEEAPIYEAIQHGQQHPSWVATQRNYWGGFDVLAAVMGKRMFLDKFLELVNGYRAKWFPDARFKTCCDCPPDIGMIRFTNINAMRSAGFSPVWQPNSNAADVREAVIQDIAANMRKEGRFGFRINSDPTRFLMISQQLVDPTPVPVPHTFVLDGLEAAYVWEPHYISVGNKRVRQPKEHEWTDGAQRCLENIWLNFFAGRTSDYEIDRQKEQAPTPSEYRRPSMYC